MRRPGRRYHHHQGEHNAHDHHAYGVQHRKHGSRRVVADRPDTDPAGHLCAHPVVSFEDEIGYPGIYTYKPLLAYGSGRVYAWDYAIGQGLRRPVLGYGFGTERVVFEDRSNFFEGSYPGELGSSGSSFSSELSGSFLLTALFALCFTAGVRALRGPAEVDRHSMGIALGMAVAVSSRRSSRPYLYSVGNV